MPENNVTDPITEDLPRLNPSRGQVLARLWELAYLGPETTRGSITGQVKALSMIIAIEGLIPDRRAASGPNKPAPPPVTAQIYEAAWLRTRQPGANADPQPTPPPTQDEAASEPPSAPVTPSPKAASAPRVPMADYFAPDTRVPFFIKTNLLGPRR
jgi:hypothetical protein